MAKRGLWMLSACLILITAVSGVVYAQQFFKYETCKRCKGTGKNICSRCDGRGCAECSFSGVVERKDLNSALIAAVGGGRNFSCPICDGGGRIKIDTRFIGCSTDKDDARLLAGIFGGKAGLAEGIEIGLSKEKGGKAYNCPDGHPIGAVVVIVDDYDKGNILKKYTKAEWAEWEKKVADEKATAEEAKQKEKEREEQAKAEEARIKQEAEQARLEKERLEHEKVMNSRQPFTDSRDGKKYLTVKIGGKIWMAENLNYKTGKSWCYDKNNSYCDKYGRLYDWKTAMKACPAGWHLPTRTEWGALAVAAGGTGTNGTEGEAGKKLKSTSGWSWGGSFTEGNANGTDNFGFSALPGGERNNYRDGEWAGLCGSWWTATENGSGGVYYRDMGGGGGLYEGEKSAGKDKYGIVFAFSVRCVMDN